MKSPLTRTVIVAGLSLALTVTVSVKAGSVELDGRISTQLHAWSDSEQDHLRPYQSLRGNLSFWRDSSGRKLSLHSYSRWTSDLLDKLPTDPQLFVYDTYLQFDCPKNKLRALAGRQYVYTAAGSALIDGFGLSLGPFKRIKLKLFSGSEVDRQDPQTVRSMNGFGVLGGRISYRLKRSTRIGLNWTERRSAGQTAYQRFVIDADHSRRNLDFFGRAGYNPILRSLAELLMRTTGIFGKWRLSAEYLYREPSVSYNSLFSVVDFHKYRQLYFNLNRRLAMGLTVTGSAQLSLFDDGNNWQANFGLRSRRWSVVWHHRDGRSGDNDGLSGRLSIPPWKQWTASFQLSLNRYRVQSLQPDRNDAYSAAISLARRLGSEMEMSLEGQYLRNARLNNSMRLLLRLDKRFRVTK